jgi:hypothetical protein
MIGLDGLVVWGDDIGWQNVSAYGMGSPGDKLGLQAASPRLAAVMKQAGYRTGHCGKNHWVTATGTCPRCTGSTSSSATCMT